MSYAPDYFFIPCTQIVPFTWMLKALAAEAAGYADRFCCTFDRGIF